MSVTNYKYYWSLSFSGNAGDKKIRIFAHNRGEVGRYIKSDDDIMIAFAKYYVNSDAKDMVMPGLCTMFQKGFALYDALKYSVEKNKIDDRYYLTVQRATNKIYNVYDISDEIFFCEVVIKYINEPDYDNDRSQKLREYFNGSNGTTDTNWPYMNYNRYLNYCRHDDNYCFRPDDSHHLRIMRAIFQTIPDDEILSKINATSFNYEDEYGGVRFSRGSASDFVFL